MDLSPLHELNTNDVVLGQTTEQLNPADNTEGVLVSSVQRSNGN